MEAPVGFEPTIRVLQTHALPLGYVAISSPSRTRTYDSAVNSRVLYRLSYRGITWRNLIPSKLHTKVSSSDICHPVITYPLFYPKSFRLPWRTNLTFSWLSPRPISTVQLNGSLRLHLQPINLVVFKGSYWITPWDISSWGGLHA